MRPIAARAFVFTKPAPHILPLTSTVWRCCIVTHSALARRTYSSIPGKNGPTTEKKTEEDAVQSEPGHKDADFFKNLPSQRDLRRSQFMKKFSATMDDLQTAVFTAGRRLNDLTGYSDIEALKRSIEEQERRVAETRALVKEAKAAYADAINRRTSSQREVNELLQRKHAWTPADLERFTTLYRSDHANEQAEAAAHERLTRMEKEVDEAQDRLSKSILARYHEEQIWSDKIRRASTWGTWGLMGFNVLLFIVVQLGLEPWKRKRLVGGFEEKVREVIQEENIRNALLNLEVHEAQSKKMIEETADVAVQTGEEVVPEEIEAKALAEDLVDKPGPVPPVAPEYELPLPMYARAKEFFKSKESIAGLAKELVSDEQVILRKVDVTTVAVGGATIGAVVVGLISALTGR